MRMKRSSKDTIKLASIVGGRLDWDKIGLHVFGRYHVRLGNYIDHT